MRTYSVADADRHFSDMLEHVRHGETVLVTENGKPLAQFSPAETPKLDTSIPDTDQLREVRELFRGLTLDDIMSARDEGRK